MEQKTWLIDTGINRQALQQLVQDLLAMIMYLGDAMGKEHREAIEEHIERMVQRAEKLKEGQ